MAKDKYENYPKMFVVMRYVDKEKGHDWWVQYLGLDEEGKIVRFRWGEHGIDKRGEDFSDAWLNGFVFKDRSMAERFLKYVKNIGIILEAEEFIVSEQLGKKKD